MDIRPIDANGINVKRWFVFPDNRKTMTEALEAAPTLSLNILRDAIYEDAVTHGLWDDEQNIQGWPLECAALIDNEVGELIAAAEDWKYSSFNNNEHFIEELADVVIICFSVAGKLDIDIDAAIRRKMEISKHRSYKHEND